MLSRRVEDIPTQGNIPPDNDDPLHPDQHVDVLPNDDDMLSGDEPEGPLDDDHQPDYDTGPGPDEIAGDYQKYIVPDDYGPPPGHNLDMPGIQDSGETHNPSLPSTPCSNPDAPIKEIADPGQDDVLHKDLIQLQHQSEFKGNRDRSQLILLVLYQRQRQR